MLFHKYFGRSLEQILLSVFAFVFDWYSMVMHHCLQHGEISIFGADRPWTPCGRSWVVGSTGQFMLICGEYLLATTQR